MGYESKVQTIFANKFIIIFFLPKKGKQIEILNKHIALDYYYSNY